MPYFRAVLTMLGLFLATLPMTLLSQEIVWEPVPLVHGSYAGHMLEISQGTYLVSGPSSIFGVHGRGLFILNENATALRDVSPDWSPVRALVRAADGGILCGSASGIWHSNDGEQWQLRDSTDIVAMNVLRDGSVWAATATGDLLRSTDHGAQWDILPDPPDLAHLCVQLEMNEQGWIVLLRSSQRSSISTDGGSSWNDRVKIDDSTTAYADGDHPFLITQRGRAMYASGLSQLRVKTRQWD